MSGHVASILPVRAQETQSYCNHEFRDTHLTNHNKIAKLPNQNQKEAKTCELSTTRLPSAGKHATGTKRGKKQATATKRGKTCDRFQARENV